MRLFLAFALLIATLPAAAQQKKSAVDLTNLRTVSGRTVSSPELPKLDLEFPEGFKYAGGHTFVLYDVARAEQHFFVDADKDGKVSRLYWVQFEGYLPDNSHAYDYDSPTKVKIGGLDFFADAYARKIDPKNDRPNSDGTRAREFLTAKGYTMASNEIMMQRLVHMTDRSNRNELMIIYMEVLTPLRTTSADLVGGGKDSARWPEISKGLLDRSIRGISITR